MQEVKIILSYVAYIFILAGCKDTCDDVTNPGCENYNPCLNIYPVIADFRIEEQLGPLLFETDTVYWSNVTVFTPTVKYDSVKWLIGSETVKDGILKRKNFPQDEQVEIMLIVYRCPNTTCYPQDDGVDTITKRFYSVSKENCLIYGYFQGYNTDNLEDTFTVRTYTKDPLFGNRLDMFNLPKESKEMFFTDYAETGGRALYIKSSNNGPGYRFALEATAVVSKNMITIEYSFNNEAYKAWNEARPPKATEIITKTFIGKKL